MTAGMVLSHLDAGPGAWGLDTGLVLGAAAYVAGVRRLARRGRRWSAARTTSFVVGLLLVFVALGSGLAVYDDVDLTLHVVQHVLVMMVAPALLVAGRPLELLARSSARPVQRRVARLARSRILHACTGPPMWALYPVSMGSYFLTPLFRLSEDDAALHAALHGVFLAIGLCFWFGLFGEGARRRSFVTRSVAVLAGMPVEAALGLALVLWPHPLAPGTPLGATRAAGQVLLMSSMVVSGAALSLLVWRWVGDDERAAVRAGAVSAAAMAAAPGPS
ncbi:MAG TPA: cytochrome c oxidase assembly protein, partial [Acidimicrobiales bacterium]|nr:cytochrome c oxidase assembly protein [Acidimicrobiales bacterium]